MRSLLLKTAVLFLPIAAIRFLFFSEPLHPPQEPEIIQLGNVCVGSSLLETHAVSLGQSWVRGALQTIETECPCLSVSPSPEQGRTGPHAMAFDFLVSPPKNSLTSNLCVPVVIGLASGKRIQFRVGFSIVECHSDTNSSPLETLSPLEPTPDSIGSE